MGLRRLPWLHEARSKEPHTVLPYSDCGTCQRANSREVRRAIGCGYEEPLEHARAWDHAERSRLHDDPSQPAMCPGYVCALPEVLEAARARQFFLAGELAQFCGGELAHPALLDAVSILENEQARVIEAATRNASKRKA